MGLIETEGLILKSYPLSEADKIVYCFTRQRGMIKAVARRARTLKSHFSGRLEPFSIADLVCFEKEERELLSIRQIELQYSNFYLAGNLAALKTLSYFAELLLEFVPPNEPQETLYRMTRAAFTAISPAPEKNDLITLYFELWLLRLSGFLADWKICSACRTRIGAQEASVLEPNSRFYCLRCRTGKGNVVNASDRRALNLIQQLTPLEFAAKLLAEGWTGEILSTLTRRIIRQTLEREPRIWGFHGDVQPPV